MMNNSSRGSQTDHELLVRQEQMVLLAQVQYERRQKQKQQASSASATAAASGSTSVCASTISSRSKSGGTVITIPDDGLSMMSTSERSIGGGGGIPAHIQREQEQILRQLSSRGGGATNDIFHHQDSTATGGTASPSQSYTELCESSFSSPNNQQQRSRRRSDRIRQRDSFTDGYSLPNNHFDTNGEDYYATSPHSSSRSLTTAFSTPGVASVAQARVDWEAKQQTHIPQVAEALAQARRAGSSSSSSRRHLAPQAPPSPTQQQQWSSPARSEVDVDDIIVERVKQCSIKMNRQHSSNSNYSHQYPQHQQQETTSSPSSAAAAFDDFRVGAFNIRNAGEKPTHPSDVTNTTTTPTTITTPQRQQRAGSTRSISSTSSRVPPLIQQQRSESEQSQSLSTMTPRTAFTNEPIPAVPVADLVLQEEPCAPPLPATIVRSSTQVRITQPPDGGDGDGNGSSNNHTNSNHHQQPRPTEQKSTLSYLLVGGGCGAVLLTIILLLCRYVEEFDFTGALYKEPSSNNDDPASPTPPPAVMVAPTIPPTPGPTPAPTPFVLDLPSYTMNAIRNNPIGQPNVSPQAKAYRWLVEDLQVRGDPPLSRERQYQRFALATLYFATNQDGAGRGNSGEVDNSQSRDTWKRSGGWLDHNLDECDWETPPSVGRDLPLNYRICDTETGLYESLVLNDNGLIGYIPPEVSLLTTLKILDLSRGVLKYSQYGLPSQLGLLTNLEYFDFYFSKGKGPVPSQFGQLTNLKVLNLERNSFIGTIPSQVGLLRNLQRFELEQNLLQGTLPSELGTLLARNLWSLNVNNNGLTGSIPETFNDAMNIRKYRHGEAVVYDGRSLFIRLFGNQFTGIIPDEMCSLQQRLDFDCEKDPYEGLCGCDWCDCIGNPDLP